MYMVEVTQRAGNISALNFPNNETHYLPADRCTWRQRPAGAMNTSSAMGALSYIPDGTSNYEIYDVEFYPGNSAPGITISGGSITADPPTNNITRLGYIGKSGRFVAMTVQEQPPVDVDP